MVKRQRIAYGELLVLIAAGLFLACGFYISNQKTDIREENYISPLIDDPLRLVLISDLHGSQNPGGETQLANQIKNKDPDLIITAGDMIGSEAETNQALLELYRQLFEICPVIAVPGNSEIASEHWNSLQKKLETIGIMVLDQSMVDLQIKDNKIRIGGLYSYSFASDGMATPDPRATDPAIADFLTEFCSTDLLKIMVSHRPDSFIFSAKPDYWDIDLVLSGHTHGGQVKLPGLGGLWAPDQGFFPVYTDGKYQLGNLTLFITSGLGSKNTWIPRINNPREIMVIEIDPNNES